MSRARRGLWAAARAGLHPRRLPWLLRAGTRALRLRLGLPAGAPLFGTLAVTWNCNYRCFMCDFPLRKDATPDTETLRRHLRFLAERGTLAVGITGGEPLVHRGLFELLDEARRLGLLVHLNTNGSSLTRQRLPDIAAAGVHSLNISLDGAGAATHDALRGAPGSFDEIRDTVAEWRRLRGRGAPRLGLVMAVSRRNVGEVEGFVQRAREWQVDAAGFLPHHAFVDDEAPLDADQARELQRALLALEAPVDNSTAYRRGLAPFLAGERTDPRCSAPRSHRAIAPDGTSYACVPLMTLGRSGIPWERREEIDPSPSPADREEVCRRCWWNCHRELDLALEVLKS